MDIFEYADELDYGELHFKHDEETGLRAIVAIHSLQRGPAIGGCRFIEYDGTDEAVRDAMRLGRGMTYKAAISSLPHGGAKSVVIRPPNLDELDREALFRSFGRFVASLDGDYITAEDSGTNVEDMNVVAEETDCVLGTGVEEGGSGDPSPMTARGILRGIEAAAKYRYDRDTIAGLTVAIQGVGSVGYHLAEELEKRDVELVVADVDDEAVARSVEEFNARPVGPDDIFEVDCDVFSPCALGAVLNDETIPKLECDIVAGSANNQLADGRHDAALRERDILYAPDYAINAGGLLYVAWYYAGRDAEGATEKIDGLYDQMLEIFRRADDEDVPTGQITDRIAEERLEG